MTHFSSRKVWMVKEMKAWLKLSWYLAYEELQYEPKSWPDLWSWWLLQTANIKNGLITSDRASTECCPLPHSDYLASVATAHTCAFCKLLNACITYCAWIVQKNMEYGSVLWRIIQITKKFNWKSPDAKNTKEDNTEIKTVCPFNMTGGVQMPGANKSHNSDWLLKASSCRWHDM